MIGGHRVTDVTRAQAKELLEAAAEEPQTRQTAKPSGNGRKKSKA